MCFLILCSGTSPGAAGGHLQALGLDGIHSELIILRQQRGSLQQQCDSLLQERNSLQHRHDSLQQQHDSLQQQYMNGTQEVLSLQQQILDLKLAADTAADLITGHQRLQPSSDAVAAGVQLKAAARNAAEMVSKLRQEADAAADKLVGAQQAVTSISATAAMERLTDAVDATGKGELRFAQL